MDNKEKNNESKYLNKEEFNKELKEQVDSILKVFQKDNKREEKEQADDGEER